VPVDQVVSSPLLDVIFNALDTDSSFDAAVDCLCAIFKETREVNDYLPTINVLFPRVLNLRPRIAKAAESDDLDLYKGITRIFAEAGEAWIIMIAKEPVTFRPLVEAVLECCGRDQDREAIEVTFAFWYELKLYLLMETYIQARLQYVDVYSKLVDILIGLLKYPTPDDPSATDLFDGDR
jgi:transportin-3